MLRANNYKQRLTKVLRLLKRAGSNAAVLISSAPHRIYSRDTNYKYHQDRDFFYLTGSSEPGLAILLRADRKKPLIFAPKIDKKRLLWDGPQYELKTALKNTASDLIEYKDYTSEILDKLKGCDTLYHQNDSQSISWRVSESLLKNPAYNQRHLPYRFIHSDNLLSNLRLVKEAAELKLIERAIEITFNSWCLSLPLLVHGTIENLLAATIDYGFKTQQSDNAFPSIVAAGKNAAVLHYHKLNSKLNSNDLLLYDIGASYQGYAADISRTVPISGKFTKEQKRLYEIVLAAQTAAISKIKHGALIATVHDAASNVIIDGLRDLKILKGSKKSILKNSSHKEFFPHGIGHSLGLDVHDPGGHRDNKAARLEKGMVFTVEPGIYFSKKVSIYPPLGIRIEDDVLVTQNGCKVLSSYIPKTSEHIEELIENFSEI